MTSAGRTTGLKPGSIIGLVFAALKGPLFHGAAQIFARGGSLHAAEARVALGPLRRPEGPLLPRLSVLCESHGLCPMNREKDRESQETINIAITFVCAPG
jgi:hypothetical protein